jgi:hypothetical protein
MGQTIKAETLLERYKGMKIKALWDVAKTLLGLHDPEYEGIKSLIHVDNME